VASEDYIWGVGEHTDYGFLTILLQDDQEGLEIQNMKNEWISAPVINDSFVVNIGDMLEIFTKGFYRSTLHRVRNKSNTNRLSFPFFYDPGFFSVIESIPEESAQFIKQHEIRQKRWDNVQNLDKFQGTTYGDYLLSKVSKVFPELMISNNIKIIN
jgi:isopenicillin N synthase-like dioxygenase